MTMKSETIQFIQRLLEQELKSEYIYNGNSDYQDDLIKASMDFAKNCGNAVDVLYVNELIQLLKGRIC